MQFLGATSLAHLDGVRTVLDAAGLAYRVNPRLVRGLDYYNLTVFEWITDRLGVAGHGLRWRPLRHAGSSSSAARPAPAVGWGMGIERMLLLLEEAGLVPAPTPPDVYAIVPHADAPSPAAALACDALRKRGRVGADACRRRRRLGQHESAVPSRRRQRRVATRSSSATTSVPAAKRRSSPCAMRQPRSDQVSLGDVASWAANPHRIIARLPARIRERSDMATHLDLEEQEQLDQLKAFWKQYGNLITWVLVIALGGYASWNGWNLYQRDQGAKAGSLYDEFERAAQGGDADRTTNIFADMKARYPRATFTWQAGLEAAKVAADKGQLDAGRASLAWVADNAGDDDYRSIARLRLAGMLLDEKKYDDATKQVDAVKVPEFAALADDRRGDILLAQGKADEAKAAYLKAWAAMDAKLEYRRLVEAKLNSLGVDPTAATLPQVAAASGAEAKR